MTSAHSAPPTPTRPTPIRVMRARAAEQQRLLHDRDRAIRTVAGNSTDAQDCRRLLAMLGLVADGDLG